MQYFMPHPRKCTLILQDPKIPNTFFSHSQNQYDKRKISRKEGERLFVVFAGLLSHPRPFSCVSDYFGQDFALPQKTLLYEFAQLGGKILQENYILKLLLMHHFFLKENRVSLSALLYSAFNKISIPDRNRICHVMNEMPVPNPKGKQLQFKQS